MIEIIKQFVNEDVAYLYYSGNFLIIQFNEPYVQPKLDENYISQIESKFGILN